MMKLIAKFLLIVLAILAVAELVPGISVDGFWTALVVAVVLSVINLTIRPVLLVLTFPITILTLGLFVFVLNAFLFWFVANFVGGFTVTGFIPAFIGAFSVSLVSWVGNRFL